jgi:hypothetical protein
MATKKTANGVWQYTPPSGKTSKGGMSKTEIVWNWRDILPSKKITIVPNRPKNVPKQKPYKIPKPPKISGVGWGG